MAGEAFNLGDIFFVFFVYLDNVGVCTYYKKVVVATCLAILAPKTSLVLVFLACLALISGRLLVLITRYINGGNVNRFSPSKKFFFFFYETIF